MKMVNGTDVDRCTFYIISIQFSCMSFPQMQWYVKNLQAAANASFGKKTYFHSLN